MPCSSDWLCAPAAMMDTNWFSSASPRLTREASMSPLIVRLTSLANKEKFDVFGFWFGCVLYGVYNYFGSICLYVVLGLLCYRSWDTVVRLDNHTHHTGHFHIWAKYPRYSFWMILGHLDCVSRWTYFVQKFGDLPLELLKSGSIIFEFFITCMSASY